VRVESLAAGNGNDVSLEAVKAVFDEAKSQGAVEVAGRPQQVFMSARRQFMK
jgi:hypothetical protein